MPEQPYKVRAEMMITGFIYRLKVDEKTGEVHSEAFMITSVDIKGWVPRWMVNTFSASAPRKSILE